MSQEASLGCSCGEREMELVHRYTERPRGETDFGIFEGKYDRSFVRCRRCLHHFARHAINLEDIYAATYGDSTYAEGLSRAYDRIRALPPEKSDNVSRVERVDQFASRYLGPTRRRLLDIGSGLAVFPSAMAARGWSAVALDPDPKAVDHARTHCQLEALCGSLPMDPPTLELEVDLVSLNKVLEHVVSPSDVLASALHLMSKDGLVYVEVPDAVGASMSGYDREEFFIEHYHVFTCSSLVRLLESCGLTVLALHTLVEPSSKFTLAAFATPSPANSSL